MIDRLIVPLDGSHRARRALPLAIAMAERMHATVELVTAVTPGVDDHQLRDEIDALVRQAGPPVEDGAAVAGDDIAAVIAGRREVHPDAMVVMSSHGPSRSSGVLTESVAAELLASGLPVVLIGPDVVARANDLPVVACIDESAASQQVIPAAAAWAGALQVPLVLLRVLRPESPPFLTPPDSVPADRTGELQRLVADTTRAWPDLDVRGRVAEYPWGVTDALAVHLERHPAQLFAVASHIRNGWHRLMHPSTTTAMVRQLSAPVLVVPIAHASFSDIAPEDLATAVETESAVRAPLDPIRVLRFDEIIVPRASDERADAGDPVIAVAGQLAAATGATVTTLTATDDDVATTIIAAAARSTHGIVCMASGGPNRMVDGTISTITGRVVRWSPRPVVLIGPHGSAPERGISEVIGCVDGSLVSEAVAELAGSWARLLGVAARVLEVVDPGTVPSGSAPIERRYVHRLAARIERDHGVVAQGTTIDDVDPARSIRIWSVADPSALFVMASHGAGLSERSLGGVVNEVVRHVANPVVVLPAHALDTRTAARGDELTPASPAALG